LEKDLWSHEKETIDNAASPVSVVWSTQSTGTTDRNAKTMGSDEMKHERNQGRLATESCTSFATK
jgi:hypothetical protein